MNTVAPDARSLKARWIPSEDGPFLLLKDEQGVVATGWECLGTSIPQGGCEHPSLDEALTQRIQNALTGSPQMFHDFQPRQGTPFQQACWARAQLIPAGTTLSYGALAESIGHPGAARAVGQAMRSNPLPIIVPCHRVISSNGALGGFSGTAEKGRPSVLIKARLLERERK